MLVAWLKKMITEALTIWNWVPSVPVAVSALRKTLKLMFDPQFPIKITPKSLSLITNVPKVIKNIFQGPNTSFKLFQQFLNINLYINFNGFH